jgi:membrane protein implicated in regulation of membrane protease activity
VESYMWWAVAGIALIIAEMVTGTFYLLVIGVAAFAGGATAFYHYSFSLQAVIAVAVAVAGVFVVNRYRAGSAGAPNVALDVGQSVVFDTWIDEKDRLARVRYRNAMWDARVLDDPAATAGRTLYITHVDGSTLHVSSTRSA